MPVTRSPASPTSRTAVAGSCSARGSPRCSPRSRSLAVAGGDFSADYSTPGSESKAAADALQERFPARSPDTVDVVWQGPATRHAGRSSREAADARPGSATRRRPADLADGTIAVARLPLTSCPTTCPKAPARRCSTWARRPARRRASSSAARSSRTPQQGPISSRGRRPRRSPRSSCWSRSARSSPPGCRWSLALFGLGIASALIGAARRGDRHARLGARPSPRCSASASASTTRC